MLSIVCLLFVPGCPGPGFLGEDDGGSSTTPDAFVHGEVDSGMHGTQPVLASCASTADCADAPGVICLTNVAGGACSRRCSFDDECGLRGTCVQNICLRACTFQTGECVAHAGACTPSTNAYCVPICYPAGQEPPGYPRCGAGLVCDPYTATCTATPTTGADNGAPCRDSNECRGNDCQLDANYYVDNMPTGFLGGMCLSYGAIPSSTAYVPGAPLPRGSCPTGSAPLPQFGSFSGGDLGTCFPTCGGERDCRTGYACTHLETTSPQFSTGICLPIDCTTTPCPSGTTCSMSDGAWVGHPVCGTTP